MDEFDPNVVLGLLNYPTSDVGPDRTNEIDIEFAQWGNRAAPIGNYTVWTTTTALKPASKRFTVDLTGTYTTGSTGIRLAYHSSRSKDTTTTTLVELHIPETDVHSSSTFGSTVSVSP